MYRTMFLTTLLSLSAYGEASADVAPGAPPAPSPDDLSKAADATADVAAVVVPPLSAPTPVAPVTVAGDDLDLTSLGLDPNGGGAFDDKLNIYGFADFLYQSEKFGHKNPYAKDASTFMLGNLNVYFSKNLTPRWRALAEIRFMAAPNGGTNADGTTAVTTAPDATNFNRPVEFGTILVERAYVEYDATSYLTVRAGHWLTPYGIWNIDHGSPAIVGTYRPYIIGEAMFPEHQTGLDLFGSKALGDYKLGYHATVSNGRSETELVVDTDSKLAFGGRLELEAPWAGTLKVGVSGYRGHATDAQTNTMVAPVEYDEHTIAGDVQWNHGGLLLQAEAIAHHEIYVEGHHPLDLTGAPQASGWDVGEYALAGYRFHALWNVMPFVILEDYRPLEKGLIGHIEAVDAGLNFRPIPTVVLKLECTYGRSGIGNTGLLHDDITLWSTQVAWVF